MVKLNDFELKKKKLKRLVWVFDIQAIPSSPSSYSIFSIFSLSPLFDIQAIFSIFSNPKLQLPATSHPADLGLRPNAIAATSRICFSSLRPSTQRRRSHQPTRPIRLRRPSSMRPEPDVCLLSASFMRPSDQNRFGSSTNPPAQNPICFLSASINPCLSNADAATSPPGQFDSGDRPLCAQNPTYGMCLLSASSMRPSAQNQFGSSTNPPAQNPIVFVGIGHG